MEVRRTRKVEATKKALGLPEENFFVAPGIYEFFKEKAEEGAKLEDAWNETFKKWSAAHPELAKEFHKMLRG